VGPALALDRFDAALLEGLDKVTGRVFKIEAPVDVEVPFGNLHITVRRCLKSPPEELPESLAFLEISETRPDNTDAPVFHGWMFASSPGLNTVEHAVYDVIVLECRPISTSAGTLRDVDLDAG